MAHISQQDLDVRLQLTSCELGDMTARLLAKIKIGSKDVPCKLQELQILQIMLNYIKCYDVTLEEVLATGTIQMNTSTPDTVVNISVNGISITGDIVVTTSDTNDQTAILVNAINSYQSVYTAVLNTENVGHYIELTGTCSNYIIEVESEDTFVIVGLEDGTCLTENCITHDNLLTMFDYISRKTGICFQPMGFDYE